MMCEGQHSTVIDHVFVSVNGQPRKLPVMLSRTLGSRTRTRTITCKSVLEVPRGQGLPERQQHWVTVKNGLLTDIRYYLLIYISMISVSKSFFMRGGCNRIYELHVIHTRYITDCLQNAESSTIFEDLVVQGHGQSQILEVQGQGLVNWSLWLRILQDFPQGQQHCRLLQ